MLSKRRGRIEISSDLYKNNLPEVAYLLSDLGFVPTEVKHKYISNTFVLHGYSHKFEEVDNHQCTPRYTVVKEDGIYTVKKDEIKF